MSEGGCAAATARIAASALVWVNRICLALLCAGALLMAVSSAGSTAVSVLILVMPHVAFLAGFDADAPASTTVAALVLSALWCVGLSMLGIGAGTGLGGMFGLLFILAPALFVVLLNTFALAWRWRSHR